MKRKLTFYGGYFLVLLGLIVTCALCCTSCDKLGVIKTEVVDKEYADSVIAESVQNYVNPLFTSVEEAITFQSLAIEGDQIDAEFKAMPEELLKNVASVCLKRDMYISKRSIVYEYRANREIYDNLPTPNSSNTDSVTAPKHQEASSGGQPYRRDSTKIKDTIDINGKKYVSHE